MDARAISNVDGDSNYVHVQVLTNSGALNREKQLAVVSQFTDLVVAPVLTLPFRKGPGSFLTRRSRGDGGCRSCQYERRTRAGGWSSVGRACQGQGYAGATRGDIPRSRPLYKRVETQVKRADIRELRSSLGSPAVDDLKHQTT